MPLRRPQHTPALVISLVALFVSLGGTAYAAIVVSSNSQVAQNTISGHSPPTGIHSNLITGTVNATDLSSGYKASVKVHCPTGLQLGLGSICFDPQVQNGKIFTDAVEACRARGLRLPSVSELALVFESTGAAQFLEWTDAYSSGVAATVGQDSSRNLSIVLANTGASYPEYYRCVATPRN
jgi:hypothetical protein